MTGISSRRVFGRSFAMLELAIIEDLTVIGTLGVLEEPQS